MNAPYEASIDRKDQELQDDTKEQGTVGDGCYRNVDKFKMEVLFRVCVSIALAFILAVAPLPTVVPKSSSFLIGILTPSMQMSLPHVLFILLGLGPAVIAAVAMSLLFGTMFLQASQVSYGFLVIVYAIYCLMMATLFFGEAYQKTAGLPGIFCTIPAMLTVSFLPILQLDQVNLKVTDLWTQSGLDNPFAAFQNFTISVCWVVVCIVIGVVLPPFRTSRSLLSTKVVPRVILGLSKYIQDDDVPENDEEIKSNIIHVGVSLHGKASLSMFEPRFWRNENLVKPLKNLLDSVEVLSQYTLLKHVDLVPGGESLDDTIKLLSLSAKALSTNDLDDYANLKNYDGTTNRIGEVSNSHSYLTAQTFQRAQKVRDSTVAWLEALDGNKGSPNDAKEATENALRVPLSLMCLPIFPYVQFMKAIELPFHPSRWELRATLWALEYVGGFVILFCLSLFTDWGDLGIGTDKGLYAGWHLMGYAFASMPTVEGTTKKAFSRLMGTVLGGFCGWVGVIVCSGSYDDEAVMNSYATVVYLVIFSMVAIYFAFESGPTAFFGTSHDHGYPIMYFVLTLCLVMLEVHAGSGNKNTITVNRIIATSSGVAMAVLVSVLPPSTRGYDASRIQKYHDAIKDSFVSTLDDMILADPKHDYASNKSKLKHASSLGGKERFLAHDADTLHCFPVARVDPRVMPLLEQMLITEVFVSSLIDTVSDHMKEDAVFFREHREAFSTALAALQNNAIPEKPAQDDQLLQRVNASDKDGAVLSGIRMISYRLNEHLAVMAAIKHHD